MDKLFIPVKLGADTISGFLLQPEVLLLTYGLVKPVSEPHWVILHVSVAAKAQALRIADVCSGTAHRSAYYVRSGELTVSGVFSRLVWAATGVATAHTGAR